jgi:hypothetical protein
MNKLILSGNLKQFMKKIVVMLGITALLLASFPGTSFAGRVDQPPSGAAMIGDVMTRPFMLGATVLGTGLFVATLPFSLLGGNAKQAGETLVVTPFKATFMRCLGCTNVNSGTFGGSRPVDG